MSGARQSPLSLLAAAASVPVIAWVLAGAGLAAFRIAQQGYGEHGYWPLACWSAWKNFKGLALPFAMAGIAYVALLLILRVLSGRAARSAGACMVTAAGAALLLRFGFLLNRYTYAGFWKELRNTRALPPLDSLLPVLGGNLLLVAGTALAAWWLWRRSVPLLGRDAAGARPRAVRVASLLALLPALVWGLSTFTGRAAKNAPNVMIIALDTVRLDHLTPAGYPRETAPNISRAAAGGAFFANTISQAPWTLSSFGSLLTGLYPSTHGAYIATAERLLSRDHVPHVPRKVTTLAELFRNAGYRTMCEATNAYLRCGLEQGYDYSRVEREPAEEVVDRIVEQIEPAAEPFFAFVHFNDAHIPNAPPAPFDQIFPASDGRPHNDAEKWKMLFADGSDVESDSFRVFREHRICVYDACIRYIDHQIGRLLGRMADDGLLENTVVAIVTDHGEEFWDHVDTEMKNYHDPRGLYGVGHGHTLFNEQLRLLFVLSGPGVPAGRIVTDAVRGIDLSPTLLDLAGLPVPENMEGTSVVPLLAGRESGDRPALSEAIIFGSDRKSLVRHGYKYVYSPNEPHLLYHIDTDPGETVDLTASEKERADSLFSELELWLSIEREGPRIQGAVDDKMLDELRALGYID